MKIKKINKLNLIISILAIILILILFFGIKKEHTLLTNNYNEYRISDDETNYEEDSDFKNKSTLCQKINSGGNVNILLLGDEITYGTTSETSLYPVDKNINNMLNTNYNVNSSFKFLENNNFTVSDGNSSLDSATDINDLDLAIISFGYNDSKQNKPLDEFSQMYSNLIGKIKSKNYNCSIIALLPPSLDEDNDYISKIKYVCEINNIDYIDLHKYFTNSSDSYDSLIKNDIPTDKGYDLILYSINQLIKSYQK